MVVGAKGPRNARNKRSSAPSRHGTIAFTTTPNFRKSKTTRKHLRDFCYSHLYFLCQTFTVMTTGGTRQFIDETLDGPLSPDARRRVAKGMNVNVNDLDLDLWKRTIREGLKLKPAKDGFQGMIHVIYELIEKRLDAAIHLMDWQDKNAKADSAVLHREANVHGIPIANDLATMETFVLEWRSRLPRVKDDQRFFPPREPPKDLPLKGMKEALGPRDKVLALVAHDKKKLDIAHFVVKHATKIFDDYRFILCTGTTGGWITKFLEAAEKGSKAIEEKIRICNSGPDGGDIQIAYAVVTGMCHKVIFLQDPSSPHQHDSDIRLFEQAVTVKGLDVELATNLASAELLIGVSPALASKKP